MILAALSYLRNLPVAAFACVLWTGAAFAQSTQAGCVLQQVAGTSRQILVCAQRLTITVERGASYRVVDRDGDGNADAVVLRQKALLVDAPSGGGGFEVITPQAIAAVRGTTWAVDVAAGKTSVFVEKGRVDVQRSAGGRGVVLGPGEGVDVDRGTEPLTVKRWGAARVAALMARLGR